VDSIDVSAIDDGFLGGDLEVTFTFVVNGVAQTWTNNALGTGVTPIGITFFVPVPVPSSTITFEVSGVEDDIFFDDPLAGFSRTFGQPENWGVGFQSGSASDSNITYKLNYTITCARDVTMAVSRERLLEYGTRRAETRRGSVRDPSEALLTGWALDRLRRDGWDVVGVTERDYVFKGSGQLLGPLNRPQGGK
jgi:hypothetical protein